MTTPVSMKLVDPKSYDLAVHFLQGTPFTSEATARRLAEAIQSAVEDFLSDLEEGHA